MHTALLLIASLVAAEQPPYQAQAGREDSRVAFSVAGDTTVIDIASKRGIDKATIKRTSPQWPQSILVRLHLKGLELFRVDSGERSVEWSVNSGGEHGSSVYLREGDVETRLDADSPYYAPVRIVDGGGKIPLAENGYFEVRLPARLLEKNPEQITVQWIDFYRN